MASSPVLSSLSLSNYNQSNPIDLTQDDGDNSDSCISPRDAKRQRTANYTLHSEPSSTTAFISRPSVFSQPLPPVSSFTSYNQKTAIALQDPARQASFQGSSNSHIIAAPTPSAITSAFSSPSHPSAFFPSRQFVNHSPATHAAAPSSSPKSGMMPATTSQSHIVHNNRPQVIDLTGTPSPPPQPPLPPDLPPRAPVCIGQLNVTALVLYPVPFIIARDPTGMEPEWLNVKLQYGIDPSKPQDVSESIEIRSLDSELFGVVEQKVAHNLGPMLGKGLIRLDAQVRKSPPNAPILPLTMLVYTPKGNIPVVGNFFAQCGYLLEHPHNPTRNNFYYFNPHNPPPGGHNRVIHAPNRVLFPPGQLQQNRWNAPIVAGKSVEVQRSQVDELFKSLRSGDDLAETEPTSDIAAVLYPHQKKALTFLLEREREKAGPDGKYSSLWTAGSVHGRKFWTHAITETKVEQEPIESKGSILADDMGLGKTITCVALIAATLDVARRFGSSALDNVPPPFSSADGPDAASFAGSIWGMPDTGTSAKNKAKVQREQDKREANYNRACRIKAKSRATLIICPLSTVANWEDQFREHWKGPVHVVGGGSGAPPPAQCPSGGPQMTLIRDMKLEAPAERAKEGTPLRVYIYHGNARRPDPAFLADFDAVITTFATLASEYSKQSRTAAAAEAEEDDAGSSDGGGVDIDERGNQILRLPKPSKGIKRKKSSSAPNPAEATSALQSIHWFRVVLDEAHCIKETSTVGSRASCDLVADRRLCLTGTPVQNKLDDVFALIKFLRIKPLDEKHLWTELIGSPVKFGQGIGVVRLQTVMKCITLRRTKETKAKDGARILSLPPRKDELRYLKFDPKEQEIYDQFFQESKAEFTEMSDKNEVMKNYVGILQKILRLRQICDHYELVEGKGPNESSHDPSALYENVVAAIEHDGFTLQRAGVIFSILRESATAQCVECGGELGTSADNVDDCEADVGSTKRLKKGKTNSRAPTRPSSPCAVKAILTRCQHLFCIGCFHSSICPTWPGGSPNEQKPCSICQTVLCASDALDVSSTATNDVPVKKKSTRRERRVKGSTPNNINSSTKINALLGDLMQFSRTNRYSSNYDITSLEVQMVDDKGNDVDDGIVKTVVFSQWTSMLDKIEDALESHSIRFDRLDGTMKRDERTKAMDALKHDPSCEVLLVSLKAGGVGLNLTAAQRVYLMDPYWNPAVENQAVDRIHRLGQTKPVTTIKLVIENSIEARLLAVQKKKTELANLTLGGNGPVSKSELRKRHMEDLNQLFGHAST